MAMIPSLVPMAGSPSLSMLHATLKSREGLGTRLGEANFVHMKMGGAGHAYFKFTDELRGGTISVQGGLPVAGTDGPGGQVIRAPMVRGDHLSPIQMVQGDHR